MKLQKLVENIIKNLNETTTSGSIAYLPGGYISMRKTISSLAGLKPKWGIKVLENEINYNVNFEDKLKVIIPKIYYTHFNEKVLKIDGVKEVILTEMLQEAITVDFNDITDTLVTTLRKIPVVQNSVGLMTTWLATFPNSEAVAMPEKVLINLQRYDRSIADLMKELKKRYGEDKGYIEQLTSVIEDNRPLNNIDYINDYTYLAGCRIKSNYEDQELTLALFVNLALQPTQVIIVDELDIAMEMKFYKDVKVLRSNIYPISGAFRPYIFDTLKDVIESLKK